MNAFFLICSNSVHSPEGDAKILKNPEDDEGKRNTISQAFFEGPTYKFPFSLFPQTHKHKRPLNFFQLFFSCLLLEIPYKMLHHQD